MKHYQVLSALLQYPEPALIDSVPEIEHMLAQTPALQGRLQPMLQPLLTELATHNLIVLQQNYVATFDRNPAHSLHLFEHIHGESRERGQAMVDLMAEYKKHGLEMTGNDLPDFVPLFLEFLSQQNKETSDRLLSDAIHVLAHIGRKLAVNGSAYSVVFDVLEQLSPVIAELLMDPPVRDMDEALETFGPGFDGVEPLLKSQGGVQPVHFYPKAARGRVDAAATTEAAARSPS